MFTYNCKILRWVDGDTVDLEIDLGFHLIMRGMLRIHGINTAELHSPDPAEIERALLAKNYAAQLLPPGTQTKVTTLDVGKQFDKYGRFLARLALPSGGDFTEAMLRQGHGTIYPRGKNGQHER